MNLDEAKERFVQAWGSLGSSWGVNRSLAQIHSILLISTEPLNADQVMETLNISRGNANTNLRELVNWGLARKEFKSGDRKEYYVAEKDIWIVANRIIQERRKREFAPVLQMLEGIKDIEGDPKDPEMVAFNQALDSLNEVVGKADRFLELAAKTDQNKFAQLMAKLLTKMV